MTQEEAHFQFFNYLESFNLVYFKLEIFLFLDYKSLHKARRVCKDWDKFIKEEIWSSRPFHTRRLLRECWRQSENEPFHRVIECPKNIYISGMAVNNKTLVLLRDHPYKTLVLDPRSGDSLGTLVMNRFDADVGVLQVDVSDRIIVTVSLSGHVAVWDQNTLRLIYSAFGYNNHPMVRVVGDFMVISSRKGSLKAFSIISDSHSTPGSQMQLW